MIPRFGSATVLGAGTMGAQIACLLAGAGARVRLLDLDRGVAANGLERAAKTKPSPLYLQSDLERIRPGGFDELEDAARGSDWIVEAVVEQAAPKRALFERIDAALADRGPEEWPLISSNTSGLSIGGLAQERSAAFARVFMGTHFFNPPRYSRLLELIPLSTTDPARLAWIEDLASRRLGKGTVRAKDRPAFIANRLGVHGLHKAVQLAYEHGLGVDEVDELTGPLIGRPRSATFRTLDLVGLDVGITVGQHCYDDLPDDPARDVFAVPEVMRTLAERGALGEKTGAGFYKRVKGQGGDSEILTLDLETLEYRPRRRLHSAAVEMARLEGDLGRRIAGLVSADDNAGRFLWDLLADGLWYAATVAPETADDSRSVDRAMRWGFGHAMGPFELWDALGPAGVLERFEREGRPVPDLARAVASGPGCFASVDADGRGVTIGFGLTTAETAFVAAPPPPLPDLDTRRRAVPGLPTNTSASIIDLGDGILGLELHGKLNILGPDAIDMILRGVDLASRSYDGLVIGTRAPDFSAGANLALVLIEAEDGEWDELGRGVRQFQRASTAIRYSPVPVVVAPRGRTLGGGAEFSLAAARRQALAETYLGLVETGVGLIPAGGGCAMTARRIAESVENVENADMFPFFQKALLTIGMAQVGTSAADTRRLGYLSAADAITADPDRQWGDAIAVARHLADLGYRPPADTPIPVVGRRGLAAARSLTFNQRFGHFISDHDRKVVTELAGVVSGGDVPEGAALAESYLLDLEREAFLRLLGEPKTRERIRYTLKHNKPLRN